MIIQLRLQWSSKKADTSSRGDCSGTPSTSAWSQACVRQNLLLMKRIAQLDGVRGIAILLVLLWHYFAYPASVTSSKVVAQASQALSLTWTGVDLFFVLSGFLIAGIILEHRESSNFFQVFYVRRICRIFPLYFLLLGLFILMTALPIASSPDFAWLFEKPFPLWSYASFTQNCFMGSSGHFGPHWLSATWSLAVEEQFYLFVPLMVYFLPRRLLVCLLVPLILAAPYLRSVSPGFHNIVNTAWRTDSLLLGALLAVAVRYEPFMNAVHRYRLSVLAMFSVFLAGAVVLTLHPWKFGIWTQTWLAGLYALFVLIAFSKAVPLLARLLEFRVLVWLGKLSYGIYIVHQPVNGLLHGWFFRKNPTILNWQEAGVTALALVIALVLAVLSFRFFESPFLRLGHRFQYLPKAEAAVYSPDRTLAGQT